jgi:rod shape-determining protein MreC
MQKLFLFFYQYRAFFFFIILEVASAYLIVKNNRYQNAAFFNSSNVVSGSILNTSNEVHSYFSLKDVNQTLAEENAYLRAKLANQSNFTPDSSLKFDEEVQNQYSFLTAKVINNSIDRYNNYITIDKGTTSGVEPGMGVISPEGVVGKVKSVSKHFATITSLLHTDGYISSVIKSSGVFGSIKWEGKDAKTANLEFVPRHIKVNVGDTVTSSGFNSLYPPGIMLGVIKDIDIKGNEAFYDIKVGLSTNFSKLGYVYVVKNNLKTERDSLELTLEYK